MTQGCGLEWEWHVERRLGHLVAAMKAPTLSLYSCPQFQPRLACASATERQWRLGEQEASRRAVSAALSTPPAAS